MNRMTGAPSDEAESDAQPIRRGRREKARMPTSGCLPFYSSLLFSSLTLRLFWPMIMESVAMSLMARFEVPQ